MTLSRTSTNLLAALGALTLGAGMLVGCTPEPVPTPTPTAAFTSEEEAFAAAEEVYRAYTERADTPGAEPDKLLTGAALEDHLEGADYLAANGLTLTGHTAIVSFNPASADVSGSVGAVAAQACVDLSESRVVDTAGSDVTPLDRAPIWRMAVTFVGDSDRLLIDTLSGTEDPTCAED